MNDDFFDWEDIISDIKTQRSVLVVGNDFLPFTGQNLQSDLHQYLIQRTDHGIDYFYPNDGFFLFRSSRFKVQAQKRTATFFNALQPDESILQKVTEIPFKMVISLNPDKSLLNAYTKYLIEPQFDYFTWRPRKRPKELVEPTPDLPLVYNLFGCIDAYESLVLDYEDLFDHIKKLLNDINVPDIVRGILNETETYIFLDFNVEQWYTQLLFRYLNMKEHHFDDRNKNYTPKPTYIDENKELFFRQQFNVKYYGATKVFFEELHKKYVESLVSEDESMSNLPVDVKIENYVSQNQIQSALNVLTANQEALSEEDRNELILLKSNFAQYKDAERKKIASTDELAVMLNKIKYNILELNKHF